MPSSVQNQEQEDHTMPYKVEYARSGRSHCKKCNSTIDQDDLRICTQVKSRLFDGMQMNWHHVDCFFERYHPESVDDIENFDELEKADQKMLQKRIESIEAEEMSPGKHSTLHDFKVEYPKSSKSMCPACEEYISENEPRIGKVDFESENSRRFGPVFRYHHVDCFVKVRDDFGYTESGDQLPGFGDLEKQDQEYIKKKLPKINTKKSGTKRAASPDPMKDEVAYFKDKRSKGGRKAKDEDQDEEMEDDDDFQPHGQRGQQLSYMTPQKAGRNGGKANAKSRDYNDNQEPSGRQRQTGRGQAKRRQQQQDEDQDLEDDQGSQGRQKGKPFGGMTPQEAGRKGGLAKGRQNQHGDDQDEEEEDEKPSTQRGTKQQQLGGITPQEAGRKGGQARGRQDQDTGKMSRSEAGKKAAQTRIKKEDEDEQEDDFQPHEKGRRQAPQTQRRSLNFGGMTPQEAGRKGGLSSGRGQKRNLDKEDEAYYNLPKRRQPQEDYVSDDDYPVPVVPDDEVDEEEEHRGRRRRRSGRKRRISDQDEQMEDEEPDDLNREVAELRDDIRRWNKTGMASTRTGRRQSPEAVGPKVPSGQGSSRGQGDSLEEEIERAGYKVRRPGKQPNYSDDENFDESEFLEEGQSRTGGRRQGRKGQSHAKGGSRGRTGPQDNEDEYTPDEDEQDLDEEEPRDQKSLRRQKGAVSGRGRINEDQGQRRGMSRSEAGKKGAETRRANRQEHDEGQEDEPQRRGRGQFGLTRGRPQRSQSPDEDEEDDHQANQRGQQRGKGKPFGGMTPQEAGRKGGLASGRQHHAPGTHENQDNKKGAARRGRTFSNDEDHDDQEDHHNRRGARGERHPRHFEHSDEIDKHTHEILSNLGKKAAKARLSGHHDDPEFRANSEERRALSMISRLGNRSAIGKKGANARWGKSDDEEDEGDQHPQQQRKVTKSESGRRGGKAQRGRRQLEEHEHEPLDIDEAPRGVSSPEVENMKVASMYDHTYGEDESEEEQEPLKSTLERQNKDYYTIKDAIMYAHNNQEFSTPDMIKFLKFNNAAEPHTGDLYDQLADVIGYGALKSCPNCQTGKFVFKSRIGCYECTGDCDYRTMNPPRVPFKIPGDLAHIECLQKFHKMKAGITEPRAIPRNIRLGNQKIHKNASTLKPYRGPKINKDPLEHFTFFVDPQLRNRQSDQKLRSFGGRIASSVTSRRDKIAVVISTAEIVANAEVDYIQYARNNSIPVVSSSFFEELKDVDFSIVDTIEKNLICDWMDRKKIQLHLRAAHPDFKPVENRETLKVEEGGDVPQVTSVIDVDPESGLEDVAHVYKEVGGHYCSEILSKVDIDAGQNKYYKLQVLVSKHGPKKFWLFRSWGRYGTTIGNHKCEEMDHHHALSMFKSIYHEKTGNVYGETRVYRRGHYVPLKLQQDEGTREKLVPDARTSKLPMPVQVFISRIFDIDLMKQTLLDHHVDVKEVPLGQMDQEQMLEAYKILGELLDAVRQEKQNRRKIVELSNYFYTLIPHNFGNQKVPLLDSEELVQRKVLLMENLLEIDIAYDLLVGTGRHHESPIDSRYAALDAEINVLEKGSELWKQLEMYLQNTHAEQHNEYSMEVVNICTINRDSEETKFSRFIPYKNRKLLWHGTRVSNLASIIYRGLKIAPPIAPSTGYMFGKGIYFADCSSKAANFIMINKKPVDSAPSGFLLLCDVALGSMATLTKGDSSLIKPPNGKDSVFAAGRYQPDPKDTFKVPSGATVPCGKMLEVKLDDQDPDLNFDEYIIYNEDQVKLEYIVEVNFHLK